MQVKALTTLKQIADYEDKMEKGVREQRNENAQHKKDDGCNNRRHVPILHSFLIGIILWQLGLITGLLLHIH